MRGGPPWTWPIPVVNPVDLRCPRVDGDEAPLEPPPRRGRRGPLEGVFDPLPEGSGAPLETPEHLRGLPSGLPSQPPGSSGFLRGLAEDPSARTSAGPPEVSIGLSGGRLYHGAGGPPLRQAPRGRGPASPWLKPRRLPEGSRHTVPSDMAERDLGEVDEGLPLVEPPRRVVGRHNGAVYISLNSTRRLVGFRAP